ncbi:MAG: deoxyribonuclease V [Actinomycetota bacterium]|nr:deoxyribonuclease V [Actinomycetota bacterium]MDI6821913.1 deoxyribonuclease V [Actinomycetota bacterium]
MKVLKLHPWNVSPKEAMQIQNHLRSRIVTENVPEISNVKRIAGADVSYSKRENMIYAAVIIFSFPELQILEEKEAILPATFPYVPGLLIFREGPALIKAFEQIEREPDLVMFDGQGIAHPRGIGIATHMGMLLDKPSIGVAKTVLVGEYDEPGRERGSVFPLIKNGREIGAVVRTREDVEPVFVSIGFKIDLPTAVDFVLKCCQGYRLPEPARKAHHFSNQLRGKTEEFHQPTLF